MVNSYLVYVIWIKKIVPSGPVSGKTLLENEVSLRSVSLYEFSSLSVEVLQYNLIGLEGFVDRLKSNQSRMGAPLLE